MKIQRTSSDAVMAANRENSQKSTGPKTESGKQNVRHNALKHGLLAKRLKFKDAEEQAEFHKLVQELDAEIRPLGVVHKLLVEEVAICCWKLQIAHGLEMQDLYNRRKATKAIMRAVARSCDRKDAPLFVNDDGTDSAAQMGWDCEELTVQTCVATVESEHSGLGSDRAEGNSDQARITAKLSTSFSTILRYEASLKRDLYRALAALREYHTEARP